MCCYDHDDWVALKKVPPDETWTDFDGPSWIQYDLFRKNKLRGPKNVNLAKFMLRAKKVFAENAPKRQLRIALW